METISILSVAIMDMYEKSRLKHKSKLVIFPNVDMNINILCEVIFLIGLFESIVRHQDPKLKYLKQEDVVGFLGAEFDSRETFFGHQIFLEQALKEGDYYIGSYRIKEKGLEGMDTLFTAGQLCFERLRAEGDDLKSAIILGIDDYELYDFERLNKKALSEFKKEGLV